MHLILCGRSFPQSGQWTEIPTEILFSVSPCFARISSVINYSVVYFLSLMLRLNNPVSAGHTCQVSGCWGSLRILHPVSSLGGGGGDKISGHGFSTASQSLTKVLVTWWSFGPAQYKLLPVRIFFGGPNSFDNSI